MDDGEFVVLGDGEGVAGARSEFRCMVVDVGDANHDGGHVKLRLVRLARLGIPARLELSRHGLHDVDRHRVQVFRLAIKCSLGRHNATQRVDNEAIVSDPLRNFVR